MGQKPRLALAGAFFLISTIFVWRTFYAMRIKDEPQAVKAEAEAQRPAARAS